MNLQRTWKTLRNKQQGCKNVLQKIGLQKKALLLQSKN